MEIKKEEAYDLLYSAVVLNEMGFSGKWQGWRMAGEWLISPDNLKLRSPHLRALFLEKGMTARFKMKVKYDSNQLELFDKFDEAPNEKQRKEGMKKAKRSR
jgi:hypothetical protein